MALWNKIDYPRRLFLWLFCYLILMMGCFVAFQYHRERDFKSEELNARLQGINAEILSGMQYGDYIPYAIADYRDLRISVISPEGDVIYDSGIDPSLATNHLDREEIAKAIRDGEG